MNDKQILKGLKSSLEHLAYQQKVMEPYSPYQMELARERGIALPEKPEIYDMEDIYDEQQHIETMLGIYNSKIK